MKRGKKGNKRGLSTIVITLIIILISLVAVGIVWVVVRNVINTGTKEVTLGQFTLDAKIKDVNVYNSSNNVSLTLKRNAGVGEFSKMNFVFSDGRNSEVITVPISLNELEERNFMFHLSILNVSRLISISIVPYIKQDNKEILGNVLDKYAVGTQTFIPPICAPATCGGLGYTCGIWNNGTNCAGSLNCGNCTSGYSCNAFGSCVLGSCAPATCGGLGYTCGTWGNGTCAGNLNCGTCGNGSNCVGGNCVNSTQVLHGKDVNENNTGVPAGHTLTNVSSTISVTESWIANSNGGSRILHDLNFLSGAGLSIQVSNFTVRFCKFNGDANPALYNAAILCGQFGNVPKLTGINIQDCEFDGQNLNTGGDSAITGDGFNLLRCNIHNWPRPVYNSGYGNNSIVQCYLHDIVRDYSGQHLEGILIDGGPHQSILRNKIIINFATAGDNPMAGAISVYNDGSLPHLDDIQVKDNYLEGGGFTLYAGAMSGGGWGAYATNMTVSGNVFGRSLYRNCGVYAPAIGFNTGGAGNSWTNNTWGPHGPYWQAGDPEEGALINSPGPS